MTNELPLSLRQAGNTVRAVYVRELAAYFLTPLAYVFIAIFLIPVTFVLVERISLRFSRKSESGAPPAAEGDLT